MSLRWLRLANDLGLSRLIELGVLHSVVDMHIAILALRYTVLRRLQLCHKLDVRVLLSLNIHLLFLVNGGVRLLLLLGCGRGLLDGRTRHSLLFPFPFPIMTVVSMLWLRLRTGLAQLLRRHGLQGRLLARCRSNWSLRSDCDRLPDLLLKILNLVAFLWVWMDFI